MKTVLLLAGYLLLVNALGLFLFSIDKHRARRHAFRIPESTLFTTALIGGSAGCLAGMYLFRHKTKHPRFVLGMPLILILQLILLFFLWMSPLQTVFL